MSHPTVRRPAAAAPLQQPCSVLDCSVFNVNGLAAREVTRRDLADLQSFLMRHSIGAPGAERTHVDADLALRMSAACWNAAGQQQRYLGLLRGQDQEVLAVWLLHKAQPVRGCWLLESLVVHSSHRGGSLELALQRELENWIRARRGRWLLVCLPAQRSWAQEAFADLGYLPLRHWLPLDTEAGSQPAPLPMARPLEGTLDELERLLVAPRRRRSSGEWSEDEVAERSEA